VKYGLCFTYRQQSMRFICGFYSLSDRYFNNVRKLSRPVWSDAPKTELRHRSQKGTNAE